VWPVFVGGQSGSVECGYDAANWDIPLKAGVHREVASGVCIANIIKNGVLIARLIY
jgi:hypothetical protein